MSNEGAASPVDLLDLTIEIIVGHANGNKVAPDQLPELISAVHHALISVGQPKAQPEPARPEPAVPIRRSVTAEYIACLECGMHAKMLKRHLASEHGLTPAAYRKRWGLSHDYPLIASSYSEQRSNLAKQTGLGRKPDAAQDEVAAAMPQAATASPLPARSRGRRPMNTNTE